MGRFRVSFNTDIEATVGEPPASGSLGVGSVLPIRCPPFWVIILADGVEVQST